MLRVIINRRDATADVVDLTYSAVDPGGFEAATITLRGAAPLPPPGASVQIYEGLSVAWWGRVEEPGTNDQDGRTPIQVGCVGGGAPLKDITRTENYIDRDMQAWRESSVQRKLNIAALLRGSPQSGPLTDDVTGAPSWRTALTGAWSTSAQAEAWYDAGPGNVIESVYYAWKRDTANVSDADANWDWRVFAATDDVATSFDITANLRAAGPGSGTLSATGNNKRYAGVLLSYAIGGGTQGQEYSLFWTSLIVFGDQGLTKRGSGSSQGFYAGDIARHAASHDLLAGLIEIGPWDEAAATTVLQAMYRERVTCERIVNDMAKLAAYHWGVWEPAGLGSETPQAWFVPYPSAATAYVSRQDCDRAPAPQRLSEAHNRAIVSFEDPAGGAGEVTVTADHPLIPAGVTRDLVVNMGQGNSAAAQAHAAALLALEIANAKGAGSVTLPGEVRLPGGGNKPAHLLKAGRDRLRITDLPNAGPLTETDTRRFDTFRIRRTSVTASSGRPPVTTVELDAGLDLTEVLNARLAHAVAAAGL